MSQPFNTIPDRPFEPVESIALDRAVLCLDCNAITQSGNCHCVKCSSRSILTLSRCRIIPMSDVEIAEMNWKLLEFEERILQAKSAG